MRRERSRAAGAGMAMAIATLAMAAASGVQAVLYLQSFGTSQRTDAFFVAFSLYAVFGIFSQSIRVTSVPLLVGAGKRMRGRDFAATLGLIAIPVVVACEPLASPLARLLGPGLSAADRAVTADALRILGGAMVLQLAAAGAATLLGVWDRFGTVAAAYVAGAVAGLVSFFAVRGPSGELSLGWSMLVMAVVTCAWMVGGLYAARDRAAPRGMAPVRRLLADAGLILGRTLIYFAINGLYLVTLAFVSHAAAGETTVLSYAYLFASYLVAGTSVAVGISRVADMTRGAGSEWKDVLVETVPHGFRYAMLVCAPALAGLVAAGADIVGRVFPASLPPHDVTVLQRFGALLAAWTVFALLVNFILPAMFAIGRARLVNVLAPAVVALHLLATWLGDRIAGADGAVGAFWVAPAVFAVVLLVAGAGSRLGEAARELASALVRFAALGAGAFGLAALALSELPDGLLHALLVGALGGGLYLLGLRRAAPRELEVLVGARQPAATPG
jgi:peptidoglycan biosynthesis protein MviN/MurJ (putative lipid II flippase)